MTLPATRRNALVYKAEYVFLSRCGSSGATSCPDSERRASNGKVLSWWRPHLDTSDVFDKRSNSAKEAFGSAFATLRCRLQSAYLPWNKTKPEGGGTSQPQPPGDLQIGHVSAVGLPPGYWWRKSPFCRGALRCVPSKRQSLTATRSQELTGNDLRVAPTCPARVHSQRSMPSA